MNPQNQASINLLSNQFAYLPRLITEEIPRNSSVMKPVTKDSRGAQMTIFYAGQVIVFDDFSAERAKEIMSLASKGNFESQKNSANGYTQSHPSFPASSSRQFPFQLNNIMPSTTAINSVHEQSQAQSRPVVVDLPMTRKASLYRFLEKRKDRVAARGPYQASSPMTTLNKTNTDESMSWLGLAPKSPQAKSESSSSSVLF